MVVDPVYQKIPRVIDIIRKINVRNHPGVLKMNGAPAVFVA
jgi:hypothetical protein